MKDKKRMWYKEETKNNIRKEKTERESDRMIKTKNNIRECEWREKTKINIRIERRNKE